MTSRIHVLKRDQKILLVRTLIGWADSDNHLNYTIAELSAMLEEPLGRPVTTETVRQYVKNAGFTWKNAIPANLNRNNVDRVVELAKVVQQIAIDIGFTRHDALTTLEQLVRKQKITHRQTPVDTDD